MKYKRRDFLQREGLTKHAQIVLGWGVRGIFERKIGIRMINQRKKGIVLA